MVYLLYSKMCDLAAIDVCGLPEMTCYMSSGTLNSAHSLSLDDTVAWLFHVVQGLEDVLKCYMKSGQTATNRQLEYILKMLNTPGMHQSLSPNSV